MCDSGYITNEWFNYSYKKQSANSRSKCSSPSFMMESYDVFSTLSLLYRVFYCCQFTLRCCTALAANWLLAVWWLGV